MEQQPRNRVISPHRLSLTDGALPLPVVPDWRRQVKRATRVTRLIDRHLNDAEPGRRLPRGVSLTPARLFPRQRVALLTDVLALVCAAVSPSGR